MSRNSTGTYSQATGNFVNGTIVDAAPHNTRWTDMGTEMTDSLSRSGKGGMLAPLRIVDGSQAAPAYAFTSEVGTGFYRAGAADIRFASGGADWLTIASTITSHRPLTIAGALTAQAGATITQSASNTAGLTVTGNGTAAGGVFTGGSTGRGLTVTAGGGNAIGIHSTGSGSQSGGTFIGGATGDGVIATGTGSLNSGVIATGGAGGVGVVSSAGTAATASARQVAIRSKDGYVEFDAVDPNKDVAFTDTITPKNTIKAHVHFTTSGVGSITYVEGFNVTGVAIVGGDVVVTFASNFANANYTPQVTFGPSTVALSPAIQATATTTATIRGKDNAGAQVSFATNSSTVYATFTGAQ
jgi:hypothetical protein